MSNIPHVRIVIAFCALAVGGYAAFSVWVLIELKDATMVGDIIGTWKSFAVAAFAFWIGSSSAGKAKDGPAPPEGAKEAADQVASAAADEAQSIGGRP